MNMREVLLKNWDYCMEQEDWYPPMLHALKDVTVEQALWKPQGQAVNSIWENVQHLLFYKERLLERLDGKQGKTVESNDDTFRMDDSSEKGWKSSKERLNEVHAALRVKLEQMTDEQLEDSPQRILSLITHDAYHIGQIIMLRKLQGSWPSTRSFE